MDESQDKKEDSENNEKSEIKDESSNSFVENKLKLTDKFRENPWVLSTLVLGIVSLILIVANFTGGITGNVISEQDAGQTLLSFYESLGTEGLEVVSVEEKSGVYEVNFGYEDSVVSMFMTKDGKFAGSLSAISAPEEENLNEPAKPILECVEQYNVTEDTIIFYYSNSCGWCSKMKPGVEALEEEGYKFKWIEGSDEEGSELIDNCIKNHMTSGGVPQFICSKTDEIHVGAFADENGELDQIALKEWVDNCISD